MHNQPLLVGMDLGTFKTSVASSTGHRAVEASIVGWAKDHVASTALGSDMIVGDDVFTHRLSVNAIRPFACGVLKYQEASTCNLSEDDIRQHREAASLLVEHVVALVNAQRQRPVYGVVGAPSRATVVNKQVLLEACLGTFDAVMIVPEPFAVAYSMGRLDETLIVDIGAGTIDLCPMYGAYPCEEDQLTLPLGGDMVDRRFRELVAELHPNLRLSEAMTREIKEKFGFVDDSNERAIVNLPESGEPRQFDLTEPLKTACQSIVDPIVAGIREMVGRFDPEFQKPLLDNILLAGGGSQLKGLDRLIEAGLRECVGGNVSRVYDSVFSGAEGALKLAMSLPAQQWDELSLADSSRLATLSAST